MKRYLTILAILISAFTLSAQDGESSWGIRAAFDINVPSKLGGRLNGEKLDLFRTGFGGTVGAVYTHYFNDCIYLEPGASFYNDTYSYKDLIIMGEPAGIEETDPSLYKFGVRIPLVIGYSYYFLESLPMRFYTGPELSYALAGNVRIKNKQLLGDDFDLSLFGKNGFMNRVDCAWKIGLGFETEIATICIDAALGMTDIYKGPLKLRENRLSISLTRYF